MQKSQSCKQFLLNAKDINISHQSENGKKSPLRGHVLTGNEE